MVRFDDIDSDTESIESSIASRGELMHIISDSPTKEDSHPITILTLLDSSNHRIACQTLLDQCCTDNGIISWKLVKMLNLPTHDSTPKTFITAAGTFTTDRTIRLTNAMLPCFSTSKTFSLELMVIPEEYSNDMNYGAIIGQESMRTLNLDTSIRHNTISWHDAKIPMVPRNYWTAERIQQHKAQLSKQPSKHAIKVADDTNIAPNELTSKSIDMNPTDDTNHNVKPATEPEFELTRDNTQRNTIESPTTYTTTETSHIFDASPNDDHNFYMIPSNDTATSPKLLHKHIKHFNATTSLLPTSNDIWINKLPMTQY